MSQPSFNVLTEGWIPVVRADGTRSEVGILDCLAQAPAIREIRDPAPIVEFGLYRLLVAFVLDSLILAGTRPEDTPDLEAHLREGRFDSQLIENYVGHCGNAFDLFHPERPFLQTAMEGEEVEPVAGMYPVVPSGTNVGHWHHQHSDDFAVSVPEAARLLTTISPFMTAGGKGKGGKKGKSPSINGAPAIYALPLGRNLYETLVLNIPLRRQEDGAGVVAWRSDRPPGHERTHATMAEALTWRPRCIQLVPRTDERHGTRVQEMLFDTGDSTRFSWIDPSLAYRYDAEKHTPVRMQEGRPLWRDAGALLLLHEGEHQHKDKKFSFRRPDVVHAAFEVAPRDHPMPIAIYGKRMYRKRFPGELDANLSLQQIRGMEGIRVREAYAAASKATGVPWAGRNYKRGDWGAADPVNRALSSGNACLYGLVQAALLSAGYSPALGFIHTGKQLSFVYDVADLYKVDVIIPAAFEVAAWQNASVEQQMRITCRQKFQDARLMQRILPDIAQLFDLAGLPAVSDDPGWDAESAMPGALWNPAGSDDPGGRVQGGVNYGSPDA